MGDGGRGMRPQNLEAVSLRERSALRASPAAPWCAPSGPLKVRATRALRSPRRPSRARTPRSPRPNLGSQCPSGRSFLERLDVLRMSVTPGALRVHGPVPGGGPGPGPLPTCGCRPPSSFPPSPGGSGAPPAVLKGAMPLPLRAPAKAASLLDPRRPLDSHLGTRHVLGNKYA